MVDAPLVQINWSALREGLVGAVVDAVDTVAERGLIRARKDAPVRHVFSGGRRTLRFRTASEIRSDRRLRARLGLAPEIAGQARTVDTRTRTTKAGVPVSRTLGNRANRLEAKGLPSANSDIRVVQTGNPKRLHFTAEEYGLNARGRYELRTGRALSTSLELLTPAAVRRAGLEGVQITRVGGRLRASIRVVGASEDQYPIIRAALVAGNKDVDYAKHQELGTRHNPAHPFLRPRLPEWRAELPAELRRAIGRLGR